MNGELICAPVSIQPPDPPVNPKQVTGVPYRVDGGTGPQRQAVYDAFDAAMKLIGNKKCFDFLGGMEAFSDLASTTYVLTDLDTLTGTSVDIGTAALTVNKTRVYINTSIAKSPFFEQNIYNPDTATVGFYSFQGLQGVQFDAFLLLHELGHQTGVLEAGDTGDPDKEKRNNQAIYDNCFK